MRRKIFRLTAILFCVISLLVLFTACDIATLTDSSTLTDSLTLTDSFIIGTWTLNYHWNNVDPGTADIEFLSSNEFQSEENSYFLTGPWNYEDGVLTWSYTDSPVTYTSDSVSATSISGTMIGYWDTGTQTGTWTATKQ